MAKISLDGVEIEAPAGAPLVEIIKQSGTFISNLCYVDGLNPYAGCRTCLVEIEGARGLQLACTSTIADNMVVRTNTGVVLDARQSVLSIINANHSDRCLTCHRRVHCQPGDICLRDDTVTHRCLTCAKNYRCELQTTNEMLDMANIEPWIGEARTYYETEQPEADRANPFLEFDPQMCIICTRCVRACDEIRHTGAITLAGRGETTRIAFGAGGPIHDSNCDFCGACIDVCPTATLLEKPNKWIAKTETWVSTTCNGCSLGCSVSMGVRNGKVVMVKPDRLNPVSWDQICVRGRFHYDALKPRERLTRHHVREGSNLVSTSYDSALEAAAERIAAAVSQHGADSVGLLVGPWSTNEEAYFAQRIAREQIGTQNVDSTSGAVASAVSAALTGAFGTDRLPADLVKVETAKTILVIADDLESSNNIVALRVKDAVVQNGARLVVVTSRYGEVCDFIMPPPSGAIMPFAQKVHQNGETGVWLRPLPGGELQTLAALSHAIGGGSAVLASLPADAPGIEAQKLATAAAILRDSEGELAIIFAPSAASPLFAGEGAKAAANLAIQLRGDTAAESLYVLPSASNVNGIRDMGIKAASGSKDLEAMLSGGVKALIVVGDNPVMHSRDQDRTREALANLDCLVVIDALPTETSEYASVLFADLPAYGKDGTYSSGDRRIGRATRAEASTGDQRDCLEVLWGLSEKLSLHFGRDMLLPQPAAVEVMNEIAATVDGYATAAYHDIEPGLTRVEPGSVTSANLQPISLPELPRDGLLLTTSRTLYTSLEGASILSEEADKLHREEFLEINPADAAALRIEQNRPVIVTRGDKELTLSAALTDAVAAGSVYLPLYFEGGVVNRLLPAIDTGLVAVSVRPA